MAGFSVLTCANLAIGLKNDLGTNVVVHEDLMGLGDAQFPGQARALDARPGAGSSAAVVPGDDDVCRVSLAGGQRGIRLGIISWKIIMDKQMQLQHTQTP